MTVIFPGAESEISLAEVTRQLNEVETSCYATEL